MQETLAFLFNIKIHFANFTLSRSAQKNLGYVFYGLSVDVYVKRTTTTVQHIWFYLKKVVFRGSKLTIFHYANILSANVKELKLSQKNNFKRTLITKCVKF